MYTDNIKKSVRRGRRKMAVSKATLGCLDERAGMIFVEDLKTAKIKKSLVDECKGILEGLKKRGIKG